MFYRIKLTQQVWLGSNQLSGPLPPSWSRLVNLRKLVVSEAGLSGELPPSWAGMKALQELWLEYNKASATAFCIVCMQV